MLSDHREHRKNIRVISKTKIANDGAGQIIVDNKVAYVGHSYLEGVSIVDVRNPFEPKVLSKVPAPLNCRSHKVQVCGNIMIANNERFQDREPWVGGMRVYDISDKEHPKEIGFLETPGKGVHRMWFVDGRYAHITGTQPGFTEQIYLIVDMLDPSKPEIIGKWWLEGMWKAGGETPSWASDQRVKAHGPPWVHGDRAYLGWTDGGMTILDIGDMRNPKLVSHINWSPPFGGLVHSAVPLPERDLLVVSQEARANFCQEGEKYVWLFDIREEKNPVPISTLQVESAGFCQKGIPSLSQHARDFRFGPHNIHENRPGSLVDDQLVYISYFSGGLRVVDIQDKYRPQEVGYFIPARPMDRPAIQTNDVFVDYDGLIYIVDRYDGTMYILEYIGPR